MKKKVILIICGITLLTACSNTAGNTVREANAVQTENLAQSETPTQMAAPEESAEETQKAVRESDERKQSESPEIPETAAETSLQSKEAEQVMNEVLPESNGSNVSYIDDELRETLLYFCENEELNDTDRSCEIWSAITGDSKIFIETYASVVSSSPEELNTELLQMKVWGGIAYFTASGTPVYEQIIRNLEGTELSGEAQTVLENGLQLVEYFAEH